MPILNISAVHAAHEKFLADHKAMVAGVLYDAGVIAQAEVAIHPGFTPRHGSRGLVGATRAKTVRTQGGRLLRVTNAKSYASAIEFGSRPHIIRPRHAKALRFRGASGIVFARYVNHPGNRPYLFLRRATDIAGERTKTMLEQRMKRVADSFGR